MRQRGLIAALVIGVAFVSGCDSGGSTTHAARVSPTSLPSGLIPVCTDTGTVDTTEGPLQDGKYLHFLCRNGKVTAWWIDDNSGTEDAPPS